MAERVTAGLELAFPMFAAFDDGGRLFVAESSGLDLYAELTAQTRKCRISVLEDRNEDGRFETRKTFADGLVFPMGLAWREGSLYVADPPNLVALQDRDGDGQADDRKVILGSFGHRDNGSLHGLVFGPDGLLYMTMGSPDGYSLARSDGSILRGTSGALIRCRPDGADPEVLCRGFVNLVEVVFTPNGSIIGTDNWFQKPAGGIRDALVHLTEGGLYPYEPDVGTPYPVTGEPLPAAGLYPAVALSGLALYRGEAFPAEMKGNLFSAQHNARKVERHGLLRAGATFSIENHDFITSDDPDFHPSDVLVAADGSLLVVDTGGWYVQHCPTGKIRNSRSPGGIYRVRFNGAAPVPDPWGLQIHWATLSARQLVQFLEDTRPAVRDRAQRMLAIRGDDALESLKHLLESPAKNYAKEHALWTLAAIPKIAALSELRRALTNTTSDLTAIATRALGLRADREAAPTLCTVLTASDPSVRLAAAEALARCGDRSSLPVIWQVLGEHQPDRFLEHALIHAAYRVADRPALEDALQHPNSRVQKAALLLLDQPPHQSLNPNLVLERITAADPGLRQAALQILGKHPDWASQAIGFLKGLALKPRLGDDDLAGLRSLILAFQSHAEVQQLIGEILSESNNLLSAERYRFLLETLAQTNLPRLPMSWIDALRSAIGHSSLAVRVQAARTAGLWRTAALDEVLLRLVDDDRVPSELRLEALRAAVPRHPGLSPLAFSFLLQQLNSERAPLSRLAAAEVLSRCRLTDLEMTPLLAALRSNALVSPTVMLPPLLAVSEETIPAVFEYISQAVRRGWRPTQTEFDRIRARIPDSLRNEADALAEFLKTEKAAESSRLTAFEPLLKGGDESRGRAIFRGSKVACAACHRIGEQGGSVGPDLTKVGDIRAGRDLIESIVYPSSTFAQGYESYFVLLKDGRDASGILVRQEPDVLALRDSSGADQLFRKGEVVELQRRATSIMPEGLENAMTADEFRDLLAYLQSLR